MITLDPWQEKLLSTPGNIVAACGRQTGKSTVVSMLAGEEAIKSTKSIMIISAVERQAELLFQKVLSYLLENHKTQIKMGLDKPTKHELKLKNGSVIRSLPAGLAGIGIRGYTIDVLICDECAFVDDAVFAATTPALLTKPDGRIILLGTPHGRQGYFYEAFKSSNFTAFHIASWDSPRSNKEFLKEEEKRLTRKDWLQEYGGEFIEGLFQFFSSELIHKVCTLDKGEPYENGNNFLGVDVASMGSDESTFVILSRSEDKNYLRQIHLEVTTKTFLHETTERVKLLDAQFNPKKIYVDSGGIGISVFQSLLNDSQTRNRVEAIDNSKRSLTRDDKEHKKLMKEDLYTNLLWLMESGHIQLFNDENLKLSLMSIQYEYNDRNELKIFGNYSHITEAIIRAAWCISNKSLNLW